MSTIRKNKQGSGSRPGSMMQSQQIEMHNITLTQNFTGVHTTLHTISSSPPPGQRQSIQE
jgi:hypothetical protein